MADDSGDAITFHDEGDSEGNGLTGAAADEAASEDGAMSAATGDEMEEGDLEAMKLRVQEMEEEAEKIRQIQSDVEKQMNVSASSSLGGDIGPNLSPEERAEIDSRSVYVGNVDYGSTAEELEQHFHGIGSINRVTILCDKFTGHPKGFSYIEFADKESVQTALALDESLFRGRQIKVNAKRTNRPGMGTSRGRGRGYRGGGRGGVTVVKYVYGGSGFRGRRPFTRRRSNLYTPY